MDEHRTVLSEGLLYECGILFDLPGEELASFTSKKKGILTESYHDLILQIPWSPDMNKDVLTRRALSSPTSAVWGLQTVPEHLVTSAALQISQCCLDLKRNWLQNAFYRVVGLRYQLQTIKERENKSHLDD